MQPRLERLDVVVRHALVFGASVTHAFVHAGVDQFVVQDDIVALGQGRKDRDVGGVAGGEIQRGLGAELTGGFALQRLMFGMIATQQTRAARADGNAAGDGLGRGVP